jgi:hypothetical protein
MLLPFFAQLANEKKEIKYLALLIFLSLFLNNYASDVVAVKILVVIW